MDDLSKRMLCALLGCTLENLESRFNEEVRRLTEDPAEQLAEIANRSINRLAAKFFENDTPV